LLTGHACRVVRPIVIRLTEYIRGQNQFVKNDLINGIKHVVLHDHSTGCTCVFGNKTIWRDNINITYMY
jgi:hypothetical protein